VRPLLYLNIDGVLNCPEAEGAKTLQVSCDWGALPVRVPPARAIVCAS